MELQVRGSSRHWAFRTFFLACFRYHPQTSTCLPVSNVHFGVYPYGCAFAAPLPSLQKLPSRAHGSDQHQPASRFCRDFQASKASNGRKVAQETRDRAESREESRWQAGAWWEGAVGSGENLRRCTTQALSRLRNSALSR